MIEKYLVIHPSGRMEWTELERRPRFNDVYNGEEALDLKDLYRIIGCDCIEQVQTVIPGIVIVIDESGKIKDPPQKHNELASRLYAGWHYGMDDICGPAVVFALKRTGPLSELDWFPLSPADEAKLSLCLGAVLPAK